MQLFKQRLVFMPASIHNAMKARGVSAEDFASGKACAMSKFSVSELGLLMAIQTCPVIQRSIGSAGSFGFDYSSFSEDQIEKLINTAGAVSAMDATKEQIKEQLGGEAGDNLCIEVISMGPNAIGIVFAQGSYDALNKDNNVLTLLRQVVQKGLLIEKIHQLAGGMLSGLFYRFIHVSAFADQTCRPPSPVYR